MNIAGYFSTWYKKTKIGGEADRVLPYEYTCASEWAGKSPMQRIQPERTTGYEPQECVVGSINLM